MKTGTREWADSSENCIIGCEHNCRYCYAKAKDLSLKLIKSPDEWKMETPNGRNLLKIKRNDGVTMFPTAHDITPSNIGICLDFIKKLLEAGNQLLIVSKPHLECVERLCLELHDKKGKMEFRFTIGSKDDRTLKYWEPGAPTYEERLSSLKHAAGKGFKTSVSMEPLLCHPYAAAELFAELRPYASEIWIGSMNDLERRVIVETLEDVSMMGQLKTWQTLEAKTEVYNLLQPTKDADISPLRWKDSYQKTLNMKGPRG